MDSEHVTDQELVTRLRRLGAQATVATPAFDYDRLLERHAARVAGARRRQALARGAAVAMVVVITAASLWRLGEPDTAPPLTDAGDAVLGVQDAMPVPRIVRADTYFAVAALEDHLASLDDALNDARVNAAPADVARLERTRAELLTSYTQLRYAERVSANF